MYLDKPNYEDYKNHCHISIIFESKTSSKKLRLLTNLTTLQSLFEVTYNLTYRQFNILKNAIDFYNKLP
ncbi:MAG: hypothetical protein ACFFDY_01390 [Candidatus Thorarchaeota archaeon]